MMWPTLHMLPTEQAHYHTATNSLFDMAPPGGEAYSKGVALLKSDSTAHALILHLSGCAIKLLKPVLLDCDYR